MSSEEPTDLQTDARFAAGARIWEPSKERAAGANISTYMRWLAPA
jgi:hypothetical protein